MGFIKDFIKKYNKVDTYKNEEIQRTIVRWSQTTLPILAPVCVIIAVIIVGVYAVKSYAANIRKEIDTHAQVAGELADRICSKALLSTTGSSSQDLITLSQQFDTLFGVQLEFFSITGYEVNNLITKPGATLDFVLTGDTDIGSYCPDYNQLLELDSTLHDNVFGKVNSANKASLNMFDIYEQIDIELKKQNIPVYYYATKHLKTHDVLFYCKPIIFRSGSDTRFVRAVVIIGLSDEDFRSFFEGIWETVSKISVIAGAFSLIIAFVISFFTSKRVSALSGLLLHRLEIAAFDDDASEVQFALRPSISEYSAGDFSFFSYSKSAGKISGDYFDYKQIDERKYVVIKADVAGHGTAAGVIAAIIATLFKRYFNTWSFEDGGVVIQEFVRQVNSFLVELNIPGKFASLVIGVYDIITGEVLLCNAGDNVLQLFDSNSRKIVLKTLTNSPVVGQLDNALVEMKVGYKVDRIKLEHGDALFFYSDGIVENGRVVRNLKGKPILDRKSHTIKEELGAERVQEVLECAMNKGTFILDRQGITTDYVPDIFDFSKGNGTIKEAITALACVQKIFRLYKCSSGINATAINNDILDYLKSVENNWTKYFCDDGTPKYGIKEDRQEDDWTLLALHRH